MKMNLLPRLLHLFQAVPIHVPPNNSIISNFTWVGQKPVKLQTLQLPKDKGRWALPRLENFYRAAQKRALIGWWEPTWEAKWKEIHVSHSNIPLKSWLGDQCLIKRHIDANLIPLWIKVPLDTWHKILRQQRIESAWILRWPTFDKDFLPASIDKRFTQ